MPSLGSGRPAARSALAKAVGKSGPMPITSPVERISGPRVGSAPDEPLERQHRRLHADVVGRRLLEVDRQPERRPAGGLDQLTPVALATNGTVRDARGLASIT